MSFFVDANVLIYSAVDSEYSEPCLQVLGAVASGDAEGHTSAAVLEEVWYIERSGKAGSLNGLTGLAYTLFTPLLSVTDEAFRIALSLDVPSPLGTNDRIHAGTCLAHDIGTIVSADRGFDRVRGLHRVDPLDRRALLRLTSGDRR